MFKKPKRHFRQRNAAEGSDNDEEEKGQEISGNSHANKTQKSDKKEKKEKSSIVKPVCFDLEDENEEEAFQIKKSSKSKKLVQRLKKENKRELTDDNSDSDGSKSVRKERKEKGMSVILNGDKAADMELDSDYELHPEDEDEKQPKHAFRTVLERGEIPDAHIIHLARKKRAQARERGDYIPLDDTQRVEAIPKSTSRLIRDDDNDASDDEEERVDFTLNTAERERQLIKDNFLAAEHGSDVESEHERDWEEQQIRKVVGPQHLGQADGTQTANYYDMAHSDYQSYDSNNYVNDFQDQLLKPLPDSISLDQIKKSLVERLSNLEQVHRVHQQEKENTQVGLAQCHKATEELDDKSENSPLAKLNAKYRFMQEVRSYLRNLIGCYNEKYPKVTELDNAVMALAKARSDKLCKRRQEDIKDEAADCSVSLNKAVIVAETPSEKRQQAVKQRRVADREARRTRRRQARLDMKLQEQHDDGLSSDDEESKSESLKYESDRETILKEASSLMDDVLEEFSSPHLLLDKFVAWKKTYGNTYNEAYVGLCLPKLLSPIIKLSLVSWNPIEV